jgi:glycosyltransferase involved in cell wall biosynthesis
MQQGLRVLMLGSDRNLFDPNSAASLRHKDYGTLVDELHIVVLADKKHSLKDHQLSKNVWVYSTNSSANFLRPRDAVQLGKKLVYEKKFVRGRSLITADSIEAGWAGLKIKDAWRIPLEVQFHTNPLSEYYTGIQNAVRKLHLPKVIQRADRLRFVSNDDSIRLAAKYRIPDSKVSILPIFVNKESVTAAPVTFDLHAKFGWRFVLLAVARLNSEKNLPLALRALALLLQKYPDIGLVVAGDGPERESLIKLAKGIGIYRNLAFVGWQNELGSYYKTANVFIQTSRFEGYGLALIEAGLSGLPVISTPVGIANELEDGKDLYICPQNDPAYLASAIADLIENNTHRENLRINMKEALQKKLISKSEYLEKLKSNWEIVAQQSQKA